jgi:SAM-dependent methyltransferase
MAFAALRNWLLRGRPGPGGADPTHGGDLLELDLPAASDAAPPPRSPVWPASRLAIEEELWGTGFMNPGGGPEVLRYAAPIGLSAAATLLLLGAGTGGPAQILATELGVWVAAHETDPDLAAIAARRIQRAGAALAKRASVSQWDRHDPDFRPRSAHHALAIDAIRDATAEPVLAAIATALKPHGQIVIVETVAPAPLDLADPAMATWFRLENRASHLPSPDTITRALTRLGFDVRVTEDLSARHMRLAVLGWRHFVRQMARERPGHDRAMAVVTEAELWTRRIRLMHSGQIRLMRWHAIGPAHPVA